jgi:acyl carrier protein
VEGMLREILAELLQLDEGEITRELTRDQVSSWDSLTHLRLITALEEEFHFRFSMKEIQSVNSVGHLEEILRSHVTTT